MIVCAADEISIFIRQFRLAIPRNLVYFIFFNLDLFYAILNIHHSSVIIFAYKLLDQYVD